MKYFLFYGTLRKIGDKHRVYNYERFGPQRFIKEVRIPGFIMVSLRYYPCLLESSQENKITAELHEVDEECAWEIEAMERNAGYSSKVIDIDGIKATIFYHDRKLRSDDVLIPSGDWCK